jgi:hypothetical protein
VNLNPRFIYSLEAVKNTNTVIESWISREANLGNHCKIAHEESAPYFM